MKIKEVEHTFKKKLFICETCDKRYSYEPDAYKCEKKHLQEKCKHGFSILKYDWDCAKDCEAISRRCTLCDKRLTVIPLHLSERKQETLLKILEIIGDENSEND